MTQVQWIQTRSTVTPTRRRTRTFRSPGIEFDEDSSTHIEDIDFLIDLAVEGRVTAYRGPSRGMLEVRTDQGVHRSYYYRGFQLARPGWRRRAQVVEYRLYR